MDWSLVSLLPFARWDSSRKQLWHTVSYYFSLATKLMLNKVRKSMSMPVPTMWSIVMGHWKSRGSFWLLGKLLKIGLEVEEKKQVAMEQLAGTEGEGHEDDDDEDDFGVRTRLAAPVIVAAPTAASMLGSLQGSDSTRRKKNCQRGEQRPQQGSRQREKSQTMTWSLHWMELCLRLLMLAFSLKEIQTWRRSWQSTAP